MTMDSRGNSHKAAGRPDGGQFDRKTGQGTDDDLTAESGADVLSRAVGEIPEDMLDPDRSGELESYLQKGLGDLHAGGDDAGIAALYAGLYQRRGADSAEFGDAVRTALDDAGGVGFDDPEEALAGVMRAGMRESRLLDAWRHYDTHPRARLKGPDVKSDGFNYSETDMNGWWSRMDAECGRLGVSPRELASSRMGAEMDRFLDSADLKAAGFKARRTGGEAGWRFYEESSVSPLENVLLEHDGYRLERDGKALTLTYGRSPIESGHGVWTVTSGAYCATIDADRPPLDEIARSFDALAANDRSAFEALGDVDRDWNAE